mgnify:CR=1 FL=1
MANPFQDFIASEFLEQTPQASYLSSPLGKQFMKRSTGVQDPAKKRFFQESFQDIYQDYLGKLGAQAREGQTPDTTFTDYLGTDPFTERFAGLTPSEKGIYTQNYNPRTRHIYY